MKIDLNDVVSNALDAFWASAAEQLNPHLSGLGDLEPGIVDGFYRAAEKAVQAYIRAGKPINPTWSGTALLAALDSALENADPTVADRGELVELDLLRTHIMRLGQSELSIDRALKVPVAPLGVAWPMNVGAGELPDGWSWVQKDEDYNICDDDVAAAGLMISAGFATDWAYIGRRSGTSYGHDYPSLGGAGEVCDVAINCPEPTEGSHA